MRRITFLLTAFALVLGASAASAESNIGLMGIGGHLDYVDPEDIDSAIGFGGVVDLGVLMPNLGLEGNVDFWSKSYDLGLVDYGEVSFRLISIGATSKYYFAPTDAVLRPFAGGGVAVHLANTSVDYPSGSFYTGSADDSETKIGIDLCGGTLYGVSSKLDLLGELRYRLVSDINQIVLRAGVIYRMGQ